MPIMVSLNSNIDFEQGIRPARNVGGLPAHTMSAAEVVSPSPKRVELAAKTLEGIF